MDLSEGMEKSGRSRLILKWMKSGNPAWGHWGYPKGGGGEGNHFRAPKV